MRHRKDSNKLPKIREFPPGQWTIKAIGQVHRDPDIPTEPIIDVLIESADNKQNIIEIGVGQLPVLKLGTQWLNGRLLPAITNNLKTFSLNDVLISKQTVEYVQMYEQFDTGKFLIPPYLWKLNPKFGGARCLAINFLGNTYGIILPLAEIARFYYCSSTDLAHSAFLGDYRESHIDRVINPDKSGFDESIDRAIIHLRQKYADNDAWTVARIFNSDTALKGVRRIHSSLVRRSVNSEPSFFNCDVPFQGTTNWKVRGFYIPDPDYPRYIVLQLLNCSHPFPFSEVQADRDNNANKANLETDIANEDKKGYARPKHLDSLSDTSVANKELNSNVEADKSSMVFNIEIPAEQFGFLEGKEIIKPEDKAFNEYKSVPSPFMAVIGDKLGTGQGDYSKDSTNQRAKINRTIGVGSDLDMLLEAVELLKAQGIAADIRINSVLPLAESERRRQWGYLDSATKTRRQYVAVSIIHNNQYFCWIEFEQRYKGERSVGLLRSTEEMYISDGLLHEILRNLSRLKGVWDGEMGSATDNTCVLVEKVKHTWHTPESLSQVIKNRIN